MALTKARSSKMKIGPDDIVIAWQGAAVDIGGVGYTIARGDRRRGSDPMVQALGRGVFVEDGVPESEWPTVFDGVVATSEAEAAAMPPKARRSRITEKARGTAGREKTLKPSRRMYLLQKCQRAKRTIAARARGCIAAFRAR